MAGRQQHTIPRFLLKGFASKVTGSHTQTWLYRRGSTPVETNISRVSTNRDFYGPPGPDTVDEQITEAEDDKYSPLIDALRKQKPGHASPAAAEVADLVAHLSMRTRFLRKSMLDYVNSGINNLAERYSSRENFAEMLRSSSFARRIVIETLAKYNVQEPDAAKIAPLLQHEVAESFRRRESDTVEEVALLIEIIRSAAPRAIMEGQTTAITKHLQSPEIATMYEVYNWHVFASEIPLPLADTVCIFETDTERRFRAFNDSGAPPLRVYLPIASTRILIGTPYKARPKLDERVLRKATAKCSYEFFVSSIQLPADSSLPKSIGEWSAILTAEELQAAMKPVLD